jgi:hypothetical protein
LRTAFAPPSLPCRGDVFHALYEVGRLVRYREGRAYRAIASRTEWERQQATPGQRRDRQRLSLAQRLRQARPAEARALALAGDVALLRNWLRQDILSLAGPDQPTRRALFDFVSAALRARASGCPERIKAVCQSLENQRQALLALAAPRDDALAAVAATGAVPVATARELLWVRALPRPNPRRGPQEAAWRRQRGRR